MGRAMYPFSRAAKGSLDWLTGGAGGADSTLQREWFLVHALLVIGVVGLVIGMIHPE
jgi:hypothetical protein